MMRQVARSFRLILTVGVAAAPAVSAQTVGSFEYVRREERIPMRDGTKLFTIIMAPKNATTPLPFLYLRTPYNAAADLGHPFPTPYVADLAREGYIFVYQDIRGLFQSEGQFVMNRPWTKGKGIDEASDTFDSIEWLLKNVPGNNGRLGALGVSYPGWLTQMVGMSGHPAVKAVSPQAPMTDTWLGDDFFHQGAFRQSYGLEYSYMLETAKDNVDFDIGVYDMYDWYLRQGTLARMTDSLGSKLPTWRSFIAHPAYDEFWRSKAVQRTWTTTTVPTLTVGGWWDQEDLFGPQASYKALEANDKAGLNRIVVGPWNHGQWERPGADHLGAIKFGSETGEYFRQKIQAPFFAWYLKDKGPLNLAEATVFEAGSNQWRSYDSWPPKSAVKKSLYLGANGTLSFTAPTAAASFTAYVSDPANPVPYRPRPIQPTYYTKGSNWYTWLVDDQRFVDHRPDVAGWTSDVLAEDVTIAGDVVARLHAATTGSDADWVVKLIDVYPNRVPTDEPMGGYQLMVSSEIMRGRYRKSFEKPAPITPNAVLDYTVDLHQQAYRFLKGHRIMVQIQSTWFPLYDRNPQTFVPNIFLAGAADFRAQTHRIHHSAKYPSRVEVDVLPER